MQLSFKCPNPELSALGRVSCYRDGITKIQVEQLFPQVLQKQISLAFLSAIMCFLCAELITLREIYACFTVCICEEISIIIILYIFKFKRGESNMT